MENLEKRSTIIRIIIALAASGAICFASDYAQDVGWMLFMFPLIVAVFYMWLGVAFFIVDMLYKFFTKPDERLFATIMLGSALMVTTVLLAVYWLIQDSLGVGATIIYAIGAYCVFAIVRWFRRHTASYYAALEQKPSAEAKPTDQ